MHGGGGWDVGFFLRAQGMRRGDQVLLMLPNTVPLWEIMLAAMKLGAIIVPATTLLVHDDLRDRLERGHITHLVVAADQTGKFAARSSSLKRIVVDGTATGWIPFERAHEHDSHFTPEGETLATDPLLLYFTSGTRSRPKLVLQPELPGGTPVHHVLDRPAGGRHPSQHQLARLGQTRVEQLLRTVECGGDTVRSGLRSFRSGADAAPDCGQRCVTNSATCPRRCRARSGGSSCARRKSSREPGKRNAHEYREEDFEGRVRGA